MSDKLDMDLLKLQALSLAEKELEFKSGEYKDAFYAGCQFTLDVMNEMLKIKFKDFDKIKRELNGHNNNKDAG